MKKPPADDRDWDYIGVEVPPSVGRLMRAAGAEDPAQGGAEAAIARLVGALPWIAVALYQAWTPEAYARFLVLLKANLDAAWEVAGAEDPPATLDRITREVLAGLDASRPSLH